LFCEFGDEDSVTSDNFREVSWLEFFEFFDCRESICIFPENVEAAVSDAVDICGSSVIRKIGI
jgi:hypothetical protein